MNSILVWVLVTVTRIHGGTQVDYSSPTVDLESCQRLYQAAHNFSTIKAQCVQIYMPVAK